MSFTFNGFKKGRQSRTSVGNKPVDKAGFSATPTVKAGPKNSNGPKGGSAKSKVKVNTKFPGAKKFPKVGSVSAKALDPKKGGARPVQVFKLQPHGKPVNKAASKVVNKKVSTRVNYSQLRRSK